MHWSKQVKLWIPLIHSSPGFPFSLKRKWQPLSLTSIDTTPSCHITQMTCAMSPITLTHAFAHTKDVTVPAILSIYTHLYFMAEPMDKSTLFLFWCLRLYFTFTWQSPTKWSCLKFWMNSKSIPYLTFTLFQTFTPNPMPSHPNHTVEMARPRPARPNRAGQASQILATTVKNAADNPDNPT